MAGAAKVTTHVTDQTTRVTTEGTFATAVVIAAKKGPINTPVLVSGQSDFLNKFTPNDKIEIGWDNAYLEAWAYLANQPNLWVVRAAKEDGSLRALYAGCLIRTCNSPFEHKTLPKGFYLEGDNSAPLIPQSNTDKSYKLIPEGVEPSYESYNGQTYGDPFYVDEYNNKRTLYKLNGLKYIYYESDLDTAFTIYANSEGDFGNDLAIAIITDKSIVKLDGCFIIRVYRKNDLYTNELNVSIKKGNKVYSNQYVKVEEHIVSLDPKMQDGYGVNCYLPEVLNSSRFIKGEVNPLESVIKSTSYQVNVKANAELKNKYIYATLKSLRNKEHNVYKMNDAPFYQIGDVIKISGIKNGNGEEINSKEAYYECVKAGYGSLTGDYVVDQRPVDDYSTSYAWTYYGTTEFKDTVEDIFEGEVEGRTDTIHVVGATWKLKEIVVNKEALTPDLIRDAAFTRGDLIKLTIDNKEEYYKAANSGVTAANAIKPKWTITNDDNSKVILDTVEDGIITWVRQRQTKEVYNLIGYTNSNKLETIGNDTDTEGYKLIKFEDNQTVTPIYKDEYLSTKLDIPTSIQIDDTTLIDPELTTVELTIVGKLTGENTSEHYIIPKESSNVDGVYELTRLDGGFDGSVVTDSERISALNKLDNIRNIRAQLIMDGGNTTPMYARAIDTLCEKRGDESHGIISTPLTNELGRLTGEPVADIITYRDTQLNINSRRMELYTSHQLIYDQFNDRQVYVSPSCFMAANIMRYARELGWHWAVAGYTRGQIPSLDVAVDFNEQDLERLAAAQVNMIIKEAGVGIINWDEQTLLSTACDLQDAHIARWIDLYLRPSLKAFLKGFLFEFNDEQTRFLITQRIDEFMRIEQGNRAVYSYRVVCDESNNLPNDIENNILNSWLYIQPTKISKEIKQEIITTDYGTDLGSLTTV